MKKSKNLIIPLFKYLNFYKSLNSKNLKEISLEKV